MKMACPAEKPGEAENVGRGDSINAGVHGSLIRADARDDSVGTEVRGNSIRGELPASFLSKIGRVMGRSFGPLFAMVIILGAMLWGPWVSLGIVVVALLTAFKFA
jgi:hypothetical protein